MTTTSRPRPVTPLAILSSILEQLVQEADASATTDPDFAAELRRAWELAAGLDPYLTECSTAESPALRALAQRTHAEDWVRHGDAPGAVHLEQEMLSGHIEGQLLKFLVSATRAVRVLEIGMFTGYSALAMAEALPGSGRVVACELDPEVAEFARQSFSASPSGYKIDVRVGPAQQTLQELTLEGQVFDLVFVDADKAGYWGYVDALLSGPLLTETAVICVDNTLMQGQPYGAGEVTANGAAVMAFNRALAADPRVEQVLVPLRDGVTLVRRVHHDDDE